MPVNRASRLLPAHKKVVDRAGSCRSEVGVRIPERWIDCFLQFPVPVVVAGVAWHPCKILLGEYSKVPHNLRVVEVPVPSFSAFQTISKEPFKIAFGRVSPL